MFQTSKNNLIRIKLEIVVQDLTIKTCSIKFKVKTSFCSKTTIQKHFTTKKFFNSNNLNKLRYHQMKDIETLLSLPKIKFIKSFGESNKKSKTFKNT